MSPFYPQGNFCPLVEANLEFKFLNKKELEVQSIMF